MGKYQQMETLPEWKQGVVNEKGFIDADHSGNSVPVWSGKFDPPAIGGRVFVRINSLGPATVIGYFTQDGYLGLRVQHDDAPEWYRKQNGGNVPGHVFGIECNQLEG